MFIAAPMIEDAVLSISTWLVGSILSSLSPIPRKPHHFPCTNIGKISKELILNTYYNKNCNIILQIESLNKISNSYIEYIAIVKQIDQIKINKNIKAIIKTDKNPRLKK